MVWGSVPDWIAAVAAVGAAMLVGWQSWETRKSANASADAATTANAAVELSRSALEIAREEEHHTRELIAEGIKARIDQRMPAVKVTVEPSAVWPPYEPSVSGGEANQLQPGFTYRLPRDRDKLIIARYRFSVENEGDRAATLGMSHPWRGGADLIGKFVPATEEQSSGLYHLAPGYGLRGYFDVQRTVYEWMEIAQYRLTGQPGEQFSFEISLGDEQDTGAIDRHEIVCGGTPLVPVEDQEGAWQLSPGQFLEYNKKSPVLAAILLPTKRIYYLSRANNLLLDDGRRSSEIEPN
jgi:hypothetical protein